MNLTAFEAFSIIFKGVKYLLKEEGGGGMVVLSYVYDFTYLGLLQGSSSSALVTIPPCESGAWC